MSWWNHRSIEVTGKTPTHSDGPKALLSTIQAPCEVPKTQVILSYNMTVSPTYEWDGQEVALCTLPGCAPVTAILRQLHMMGKSSGGNCHRNTSAHYFSSVILQHLCNTYRSHWGWQGKLLLVLRQFSTEKERRRASTALTFSFPLSAYQMLGDWRLGTLDPAVWHFTHDMSQGIQCTTSGNRSEITLQPHSLS